MIVKCVDIEDADMDDAIITEICDLREINEQQLKRRKVFQTYFEELSKRQVKGVIEDLVERRKKLEMSQKDISDITGIATPNIARFESCKSVATVKILMEYAAAVGMEIEISVKPATNRK